MADESRVLTKGQIAAVEQLLTTTDARAVGQKHGMWTSLGVHGWLVKRYRFAGSTGAVDRILTSWGLEGRRVRERCGPKGPPSWRQWRNDEYPFLLDSAARRGAEVLFVHRAETDERPPRTALAVTDPRGAFWLRLTRGRPDSTGIVRFLEAFLDTRARTTWLVIPFEPALWNPVRAAFANDTRIRFVVLPPRDAPVERRPAMARTSARTRGLRAVANVLAGESDAFVAREEGLRVDTLRDWVKLSGGVSDLDSRRSIATGPQAARVEAADAILRATASRTPQRGGLWTAAEVVRVCGEKLGRYKNPKHLPLFLHRLGIATRVEDALAAAGLDPTWTREIFPALLDVAVDHAVLVFVIQRMPMPLDPTQTVLCATAPGGRFWYAAFPGEFRPVMLGQFLSQLLRGRKGTIWVVLPSTLTTRGAFARRAAREYHPRVRLIPAPIDGGPVVRRSASGRGDSAL